MQFLTHVLLAATMMGVTMVSAAPSAATLSKREDCSACNQIIGDCAARITPSNSQPQNAQEADGPIFACIRQAQASAVCKATCPSIEAIVLPWKRRS
ncbi:MAG: hypothetical protein M1826_003894 [Phylliscum demangeonii]|nr:MAG: hypothetical protein M1826_003894 [Phylliscum demangeonii]